MNDTLKEIRLIEWLFKVGQIFLYLFFSLVSGCNPDSTSELFLIPEAGLRIEKPRNWKVEYFERSGLTVIESENVWQNASARIEIYGNACLPSSWINRSEEALEHNIERIRILYNLEAVAIIQEPTRIETLDYDVINAVIAIPSMAMVDDQNRILAGNSDPETLQLIELFVISNEQYSIMTYLYKGKNENLNSQAQKIIESAQFECLEE